MIHLVKRFEKFIDKSSGECWTWLGSKSKGGYGQFSFCSASFYAHRVSYELYNGQVTPGLNVLHSCDNRCCVNPEHLWLGTQKQNIEDARDKHRMFNQTKTHCPSGHEYDSKNTRLYKRKKDGRISRICKKCAVIHVSNSKKKRFC